MMYDQDKTDRREVLRVTVRRLTRILLRVADAGAAACDPSVSDRAVDRRAGVTVPRRYTGGVLLVLTAGLMAVLILPVLASHGLHPRAVRGCIGGGG